MTAHAFVLFQVETQKCERSASSQGLNPLLKVSKGSSDPESLKLVTKISELVMSSITEGQLGREPGRNGGESNGVHKTQASTGQAPVQSDCVNMQVQPFVSQLHLGVAGARWGLTMDTCMNATRSQSYIHTHTHNIV